MMKPIVAINTPTGAAAAAAAVTNTPSAEVCAAAAAGGFGTGFAPSAATGVPAGGSASIAATGSSVASSVLVVDRLYDPRVACSTDPETGEEVLLSLQHCEQQPLLTGQRFCRSVVVTSTVAAERDLQVLVQVRGWQHQL
jgi:hypothetical protein